MSFGFPAYEERVERFKKLSRKKLLHLSEDALVELGWGPHEDGKWSLRASVPPGLHLVIMTWGARFTVDVDEGELFIRSEGSFPLEWLDVGQHSANIKKFLDRIEDILEDER